MKNLVDMSKVEGKELQYETDVQESSNWQHSKP